MSKTSKHMLFSGVYILTSRLSAPLRNIDLTPFYSAPTPLEPTRNNKKKHSASVTPTINKNILLLFWKGIPQKIKCCVYIMHVEFSGRFPGYTIFTCKFKIDKSFLFIKRC